VADPGVGIPKEDLPEIFDPFFTTKRGGTGLGLAASDLIVRSHGGAIAVESETSVGSTFEIYLPAAAKAPDEREADEDPICAGEGKILAMDDEAGIRRLLLKILTRAGYEVRCAADGAEAVDIYKEASAAGEPFDAVILDLTVPGATGGEKAIEELLIFDPGVKAIVASGYSSDPVLADYKEYGFRAFAKKPFNIFELTKTVKDAVKGG